MNIAKCLAVVLLSLVVSECASAQGETDPTVACILALDTNPDLKVLQGKVALSDVRTQTLKMLASGKKPNKAEKAALSLWVAEEEKCKQLGNDWRMKNYPATIIALAEQNFEWSKSTTADLYAGKLTFGAFAKTRSVQYAKFSGELTDLVQKILAELKAKTDRESAERAAQQAKQEQDAKDAQRRANDLAAEERTRQFAYEQQKDQQAAQEQQAKRAAILQLLTNQQQQQQLNMQQLQNTLRQNTFRPGIMTNCNTVGHQTNCYTQ